MSLDGTSNGQYKKMSSSAAKLYMWLKIIEHSCLADGEKEFYYTDRKMVEITGISTRTLIRARKELIELGLIKYRCDRVKFYNGQVSDQAMGIYEILDY